MERGLGGKPAVLVKRGPVVESVHRAIIAVAAPEGRIVARLGDPRAVTYLRSSAKPFQTLGLVRSGAADAFDLAPEELAVTTGSHGGEDRHVKAVEALLAKAGVGHEALQCGKHPPMHGPSAARVGEHYTAVHQRCSGKHAGMLVLARHLGVPASRYIDPASAGQRLLRRLHAEVGGVRRAEVRVGVDGCSAPNFAMPVGAAAVAFARLGAPERSPVHADALARVRDAMLAHPGMVAGEGRFDTEAMERFGGRLVTKHGAEGFQGAGARKGLGVALKIEDGNARACALVLMEALRQLRVASAGDLEALDAHLGRATRNWAGLEVGGMAPAFRLRGRGR